LYKPKQKLVLCGQQGRVGTWRAKALQEMRKDQRQIDGQLTEGNFADSVEMWPSTAGIRCAGVANLTGFTVMFKLVPNPINLFRS
jgi:hypothetical protein